MVEKAKITLSVKELELVCNTDWILTKQQIIQKVYTLFGDLIQPMQELLLKEKERLPREINISNPKISKGENYLGLPYVMLDHPRHFKNDDTLAIRTFFWWGNFFSMNLQLSGKSKEIFMPVLLRKLNVLQQNAYWICVSDDPWHHHFEAGNYVLIKDISAGDFGTMLQREGFIKIAVKMPLQQWDNAPLFLERSFEEMIALLIS